ncbi:hypothetical protein RFI_01973 [Reticulomyxa filosa]|uniref:Outer kinetochore KNL1 complex subunit KRE28 n=1 Tax=Reticulomyxa filosa TaxID=46433 RepID=X6PAL1_RETFI|nr:hypothetical protein RFI_01973 [Reticulomyxa filosa]|eukprot:ETO35099.1 hypothetical protein RFI_01973 [Reticulomyxa filosa]
MTTFVITPVDGRVFKQSSVLKLIDGNLKQLAAIKKEKEKDKEKSQKKKKKQMKCINKFVLLKNVSPSESEKEITEALTELGFKVEIFRYSKVFQFGTSNDVRISLQDKELRIGYRLATCELFNNTRA